VFIYLLCGFGFGFEYVAIEERSKALFFSNRIAFSTKQTF